MLDRLRNMTSIYLVNDENMLLLYRQGGRVVNNVWTGSAGGQYVGVADGDKVEVLPAPLPRLFQYNSWYIFTILSRDKGTKLFAKSLC